ncbi:Signal transduction histidine kinase [Companilactobacillus nodensis DSM 19682 = JCM 14932 = NBRC 107160]|uniref:histidine kinase n=2 Tax=Companilactobacillus nodensis TaxID=460870 RepID=A0A0R1KC36_9LACO|nr:Signal transduction histidine kinase [Companilactobacillus nodensis DSM 19682 = JCM 14932 = NBRC 107160]
MQGRWRRTFIAATSIALASQVNFQIYAPGFILTLAALLLPIFLYFNDDINPIQLMFCIAMASPIFRGLLLFISHDGSVDKIIQFVVTDMVFYLTYGVIYYFLYWRRGVRNNSSFFLIILICDYVANFFEISLLTDFSHYTYELFQIIFITALIRTLLSCLLAFLYHYFTLMVRQEKHEQRYYQFIWIAASVKSEVYFMKKNISEIENVMKNAYLLNQDLKDKGTDQKQQDMALDIARDVHEIKKDYQNVIRGLGDYFGSDNNMPMMLSDVLKVITNYIRESIKQKSPNVVIEVKNNLDLVIPNHYYLVSIISNLIFNAVDALDDKPNGLIRLTVEDKNDHVILNVSDNGIGMDEETKDMIFQPGFTTKFNASGDVYRGIGLSHVALLVKEQFDGTIQVDSQLNKGTNFKVTLNKNKLLQEETAE